MKSTKASSTTLFCMSVQVSYVLRWKYVFTTKGVGDTRNCTQGRQYPPCWKKASPSIWRRGIKVTAPSLPDIPSYYPPITPVRLKHTPVYSDRSVFAFCIAKWSLFLLPGSLPYLVLYLFHDRYLFFMMFFKKWLGAAHKLDVHA